jgi:hypothetical protein
MQTNPKHYTVNTLGDNRITAGRAGYHAYYANDVTAIEVQAKNKKEAGRIVRALGLIVLYIFE